MPLDAHAITLIELVEARRSLLAERVVERLRHDLPSYSSLPAEELVRRVEQAVTFVCDSLRNEGAKSPTMLTVFADLGRARSREGFDQRTLVKAARLTAREAMDVAQALASESGIDTEATFALTAAVWDWVELIVEQLSPDDPTDDERRVRDVAERRLVRMVVGGEARLDEIAEAVAACDLDPGVPYFVVRASARETEALAVMAEALRPARARGGAVTTLGDEVVGLLLTLPSASLSFPAGAGPAVPAASGRQSYLAAGRVLRTAALLGLPGLSTLNDLGLKAAVSDDPLVGEVLAQRYLTPLGALSEFGDQLLASVRTYFACGQSIEEAAKALFIHPNTLRHRLARFEEATSSSLRSAENVAEIWWVLTACEMSSKGTD